MTELIINKQNALGSARAISSHSASCAMFDVALTYADWKSDKDSFAGEPLLHPGELLERLALDPAALLDEDVWQSTLTCVCPSDDELGAREWLGVVIGCMRHWSHIGSDNADGREGVEKSLFLGRMHMARLDADVQAGKAIPDVAPYIQGLLDAEALVLSSGLEQLVPATAAAERNALALLYMEPAFQLLQHEKVCADASLVHHIVRVVCLGVKLQHQQALAQSHIVQLLKYYDFVPRALVQLLQVLKQEYNHTLLAEAVFRDVATRAASEDSVTTDQRTPQASQQGKTLSAFLKLFVAAMPDIVAAQLPAATPLFESPAAPVRQGALELASSIMRQFITPDASSQGSQEAHAKAVKDLLELVMPRVNDVSYFCRVRTLQTLASIATEPAIVTYRPGMMETGISKMKDRTQTVRRAAIRLVKLLIESHPYTQFGARLERKQWERRQERIKDQMDSSQDSDEEERLALLLQYHEDALEFITQADEALGVAQSLLQSHSKTDILDAMDLLVTGDAFGLENAQSGIRQMVHLVWAKADNDDENVVAKTAIQTYSDLFLMKPPNMSPRDACMHIARDLVGLTDNATQGELTSLERLLNMTMEADRVAPGVVMSLFSLYSGQERPSNVVIQRGAAAILAMLAGHDRNIALGGMRYVLTVGLAGDDILLAKWSCVLAGRSASPQFGSGLPVNHDLFVQLTNRLLVPASSGEWFGLAKEAIKAMVLLCEAPDQLFTQVLQAFMSQVFGESPITGETANRVFGQLLFVAGEIGLNLLVHLEKCETEFKRRRSAMAEEAATTQSTQDPTNPTTLQNDDEMIGGQASSVEDSFSDALREIKEREIMYSDRSLLKVLGAVVADLCRDELQPQTRHSSFVAVSATHTLAKFMCVSSRYGSEQLPLLLELMQSHPSSVIRSNLVVAMADVAVAFNQLVDRHTELLYARLTDPYPVVQRTCIVALTFLILAGQIKVKGQLVEMAKATRSADPKIANLATMFFRELSTKDNAVYNAFLDILSGLAADESVKEHDMLAILRFLAKFIDKDRQIKQLSEKLVARMPRCDTNRQWNGCVAVLRTFPNKLSDETKALIERGYQPLPGQGGPVDEDEDGGDQDILSEDLQNAMGDMSIIAS